MEIEVQEAQGHQIENDDGEDNSELGFLPQSITVV